MGVDSGEAAFSAQRGVLLRSFYQGNNGGSQCRWKQLRPACIGAGNPRSALHSLLASQPTGLYGTGYQDKRAGRFIFSAEGTAAPKS